jgi:hypothetical protein
MKKHELKKNHHELACSLVVFLCIMILCTLNVNARWCREAPPQNAMSRVIYSRPKSVDAAFRARWCRLPCKGLEKSAAGKGGKYIVVRIEKAKLLRTDAVRRNVDDTQRQQLDTLAESGDKCMNGWIGCTLIEYKIRYILDIDQGFDEWHDICVCTA